MCEAVTIDNIQYDTVEALRKVCPIIISHPAYASIKDSSCLCQVDLGKTADANGFMHRRDEKGEFWVKDNRMLGCKPAEFNTDYSCHHYSPLFVSRISKFGLGFMTITRFVKIAWALFVRWNYLILYGSWRGEFAYDGFSRRGDKLNFRTVIATCTGTPSKHNVVIKVVFWGVNPESEVPKQI